MPRTVGLQNYYASNPKLKISQGQLMKRQKAILHFDIEEFKFPEDERAALHNVHFTLKRGETIGIVGKTGSG